MDENRVTEAFGVGAWGAIASSLAALVGVIVQQIITFMKVRGDLEHQRRLDELELAKLRAALEARDDE